MLSADLVYSPMAGPVARAIVTAGAYLIKSSVTSTDDFYTWKSGIRAPVYTDCRRLNLDPGARAVVSKALGSAIRASFDAPEIVIGIAEAGIVWSTLAAAELGLPHAFVRKSAKQHGIKDQRLECNPDHGLRAVIVDDLAASGTSLIEAMDIVEQERLINPVGILTIVNWDFMELRDQFRDLDVPVKALVSYPELLDACKDLSVLSEPAAAELIRFYRNPRGHEWNLTAFASDQNARSA